MTIIGIWRVIFCQSWLLTFLFLCIYCDMMELCMLWQRVTFWLVISGAFSKKTLELPVVLVFQGNFSNFFFFFFPILLFFFCIFLPLSSILSLLRYGLLPFSFCEQYFTFSFWLMVDYSEVRHLSPSVLFFLIIIVYYCIELCLQHILKNIYRKLFFIPKLLKKLFFSSLFWFINYWKNYLQNFRMKKEIFKD